MRTFVDRLEEKEPLRRIVLANMRIQASLEALRLFEDPDQNEEVEGVLIDIKRRLVRARDRRKDYRSDYEGLQKMVIEFKQLCEIAGIELKWRPKDLGKIREEVRDEAGKSGAVPLGRVATSPGMVSGTTARGTLSGMTRHGAFTERGERPKKRIPLRSPRRFIDRPGNAAQTLIVGCPGFGSFPESIIEGERILLGFLDGGAPIEIEVVRIREHETLDDLLRAEDLKKWAPLTAPAVARSTMMGMFARARAEIEENGLFAFEFEKVGRGQ